MLPLRFWKRVIEKSVYRPRFPFYFLLRSLVAITDSLLTILVCWFGYESVIYSYFCEWNLREDAKAFISASRAKKNKMKSNEE